MNIRHPAAALITRRLEGAAASILKDNRVLTVRAGSCHCGAIRFELMWDIAELTTCDCSLCVKRNALMAKVPENALSIVDGEGHLVLYQWNTRRAEHFFCRVCGIYVFHRKRAAPDHFGVNVFCLDGFDMRQVPIRATEGASMTVVAPDGREEWPGPRTVK